MSSPVALRASPRRANRPRTAMSTLARRSAPPTHWAVARCPAAIDHVDLVDHQHDQRLRQ
jgi:hypothetical protein